MKTLNISAIQSEIHENWIDLKSGCVDVYEFCSYISNKYYKEIDPEWGERINEDPYTDLTFAMLEINGIDLY